MICGTSTGGMIAAGLSVPVDSFSNTPKFKAYEILNLIINDSDKIFYKNTNGNSPKYSSVTKLNLMNKWILIHSLPNF